MTTQEKLLEAAEAALEYNCLAVLETKRGLVEKTVGWNGECWEITGPYSNHIRCLYLCFLAAAWEDL